MTIWTGAFWKAAAERAVKSAAQGAALVVISAPGFDALHADWETIGGGALGMAFLSLLTSLGSDVLTGNGPSLTNAEELPPSE